MAVKDKWEEVESLDIKLGDGRTMHFNFGPLRFHSETLLDGTIATRCYRDVKTTISEARKE